MMDDGNLSDKASIQEPESIAVGSYARKVPIPPILFKTGARFIDKKFHRTAKPKSDLTLTDQMKVSFFLGFQKCYYKISLIEVF